MSKKIIRIGEQVLTEGIHFYIENGFYVFTEIYLLERGFCCKSGCRHCPYDFKKENKKSPS